MKTLGRTAGRVVAWIVGLPLAVVVVVFAVANRQTVELDLWPLPYSIDLPIYLAVLVPLLLGLLLGAAFMLPPLVAARRRARHERRRAESLERQASNTDPVPKLPV
jgi:uncharacterized integral membrane protein